MFKKSVSSYQSQSQSQSQTGAKIPPGLIWPRLSLADAKPVQRLLEQLELTQYWSPQRLQRAQCKQLTQLAEFAFEQIPFYRQRLLDVGWRPDQAMDPAIWQQLPILTRQQIQAQPTALQPQLPPPGHGPCTEVHTSGSTGKPIRVRKTALASLFYTAMNLRDHRWHRRDLGSKVAVIKTFADGVADYPHGIEQANWGRGAAAVQATGPLVALAISASIEQQYEWLLRQRPRYLLTFPSLLRGLAILDLSQGRQLGFIEQVMTLGETVDDSLRDLCSRQWGKPLTDCYTAQEVNYMALQCPQSEHYHIQSEAVYLEVLDSRDQPCAPGEIGRVVVTPLHNFAMPLLRYELGDYAEVGAPCHCGRGLPVLRRILGRSRNLLRLPDGQRLWPRLSELRYSEIVPVTQFQMLQRSPEQLEVKLVTQRAVSAEEEAQLRQLINSRIGHPFHIDFSYHDQIPRSASGKFEDFRCDLEDEAGSSG